MINCLHHFEILTHNSKKLLNFFINGFNFRLVECKKTDLYNHYLINSNSINFLITSPNNRSSIENSSETPVALANNNQYKGYLYNSSLNTIRKNDDKLYNKILNKKDTVFNAAFQVRDLDCILKNCQNHNVKILKDKHILFDENYSKDGYVESALIESCVEGVTHSLFDIKNYKGSFLPGFNGTANTIINTPGSLIYFDHLTYATFHNTSNDLIEWYRKIFNMKRFKNRGEENNGLIIKTGKSGMNLKVINYWLCAEAGVEFKNDNEHIDNSFKFVIAEPFKEDTVDSSSVEKKKNQIAIFLEENEGPGIQHIGLFSNDIVRSVEDSKKNNLDIKYYETPEGYYNKKAKIDEIERCGLDANLLKENFILLDKDADDEKTRKKTDQIKNYLLQVFTQPIFDKNTLFLELIQRVGNSKGFGAGNIKALWNAVQSQMKQNIKT